MNDKYPVKSYDSVEYGLLVPEVNVVPERKLLTKKRRISWPKCLCMTFLVILATFFLITAAIATCTYMWTKHQVQRFTTETPVHYPIHSLPEAELDIVKDRAKLFYDTIKAGETPEMDLEISEEEINAFIAHSDFLRGNAYVQLEDNKFHADMSLPAKGLPGGKGRFFVASGALSFAEAVTDKTLVTTELETLYKIEGLDYPKLLLGEFLAYVSSDGKNTLNLQSGQFYNWVAPDDYIQKKENLLDHMCDDEDYDNDKDCQELSIVLDGIEGVSITDKNIVFRARRDGGHRRLGSMDWNVAGDKEQTTRLGGYARRILKKVLF
uniref:Uncharacterized protein n=1 Tax=Amphora coffeiformis TaxID=265554 RepID=A0A7S3P3G1_9STRA